MKVRNSYTLSVYVQLDLGIRNMHPSHERPDLEVIWAQAWLKKQEEHLEHLPQPEQQLAALPCLGGPIDELIEFSEEPEALNLEQIFNGIPARYVGTVRAWHNFIKTEFSINYFQARLLCSFSCPKSLLSHSLSTLTMPVEDFTSKKFNFPRRSCGVLGATGSVGQRFILLLANHPHFELTVVGASKRSAGQKYSNAAKWKQAQPMSKELGNLIVQECVPEAFKDCDIVFSALDSDVAGEIGLRADLPRKS